MSDPCPRCGRERTQPAPLARATSWPLIGVGIVFAIPTVGLSLVATMYGVFLRQPTCRCDDDVARPGGSTRS